MEADEKIFAFVRAVLNLFKAAPKLEEKNFPEYILDNEKNLANGFFVTEAAFKFCPCLADEKIFEFIKEKFGHNIFELNQSFYKSFATVADSTPQKILANKLLHYMSTYGLESFGLFDRELVYIPNDILDLPEDSKPIKIFVVDAIDPSEIKSRALKMTQSGAALSKETLDDLAAVIKFLGLRLNVDDVPNKEFAIRLCKLLDVLPDDPVQFLRLMIYEATGSTLLIKNEETFLKLKNSAPVDEKFSRYIERNGLKKLAEIFHRFKPLWLAFKPQSNFLRAMINKMRKLADRHHKPLTPKFLERLTSSDKIDLDRLKRELANVTVFRKISLANAVLYRSAAPENIFYNIRNGKIFATDFHGGLKFDAQKILGAIVDSIVEDIRPNVDGKKIFIPEKFIYAAPVSEKNFIGNIPGGSSYAFEKKSVVLGVHWFNLLEDGREERVDLDLHLNSDKRDIGWQNDFDEKNFFDTKERKVIFSGDMTDAPIEKGGATEAFFVGETLADEMLMLNLNNYTYGWYQKPVPFKLILADVSQEKIDRKYLLDAHEISFCVPGEIDSGEMFLGFLLSDESGAKKFYFYSRNTGKQIVAKSTELTEKINSAMMTAFKSSLSLNEILKTAGAVLDDVTAEECDINLAPPSVTKDVLLGLFAK